jgi:DNA-directed RNA polymerase specialized sigma24 family protein
MSHKGSSPRPLDLFEVTLTIPTPASEPAPASAKPSELASLSDAQLAKHLGQLQQEVQRRMKTGRGSRPELEAAMKQASASLKRLVPDAAKQGKSSRARKTSSGLQEGQRKAVRAALLAGVAPGQVARHFGLSLAAVRKVLDETA